ncbi:helix-turn-helix transcriptional regulator [Flavobacterium sp. DG1-102-2]|uniref:helix-turn-helix domain-containing protein n=1 Tax=Flavobacterium sp. DG1-102-2 TaxID=3081663 RepID=UPI00294A3BAA|nr:helix-turn-helix transcriptional regulator [Flavobacterium sp. DG1-102-2]MDV6169053.1 helix-turn-helix transcriptional regulator [Flavobacterium sp. DG1-102-2]
MLKFKDKRLVKFGEHVRQLREKLGMTHADIVNRSTLTKSDVASIEEGGKNFGFTTLLELAKGLGVSTGELLNIDL